MSTLSPLVSIIIPIFNSEKYLAQTIASALNQTWQNIEIILVDDGSTDNSYQIAKSYQCSNIKVFTQENKGASAARNFGLREAKGDYIQFLDADDLLSKEKLEKQINLIKHDNAIISFCENINFKEDINVGTVINISFKHKTDPFELLVDMYGGYGNPTMIAVHSWLTPREIISEVGFWNEELSLDDDGEYFCRVVLKSKEVLFCDEVKSYYRKFNHNSLSTQKSFKHYQSEMLSTKLKASYLLTRSNSHEVRKALVCLFTRVAILCYPQYNSLSKEALQHIKELNVKPTIPIMGGSLIELIKEKFGWKAARLLQTLWAFVRAK